jgi:asparagine synthase (glutamine-hydrolysing)
VRAIDGEFAVVQVVGKTVRMARTIARPMRYFLAKFADGPCLIVARRIDQIQQWLEEHGTAGQFHPSYTRMVPAHHLLELQLVGCPDPNPRLTRFFTPMRNRLPNSVEAIGREYVGTIKKELERWLDRIDAAAPIGVLFSGGIDSGAILVLLNHCLLERGSAPTRLKAITLNVAGAAADFQQALEFCRRTGLEMLLEEVAVPPEAIDWREAVRVVEDYKPLDIQSAAMALAVCREWRERYPDWKYLVDGDGGDENLKDYPIEGNPELTIRSVLNNRLLYQEGWGVDAIKHSLTYSGGQSRGHVRSAAPAHRYGFSTLSPYALPNVVEVAEGIPFIELTQWDHQRLYDLKGAVMSAGILEITGTELPVFPKRRFQEGAVAASLFGELFPKNAWDYRHELQRHFSVTGE